MSGTLVVDCAPPRRNMGSEAQIAVADLQGGQPRTGPRVGLPVQASSFVGRERELDELKGLLAASRLLTLTGPGGCGKTRLALQTAAYLAEDFEESVGFVELAAPRRSQPRCLDQPGVRPYPHLPPGPVLRLAGCPTKRLPRHGNALQRRAQGRHQSPLHPQLPRQPRLAKSGRSLGVRKKEPGSVTNRIPAPSSWFRTPGVLRCRCTGRVPSCRRVRPRRTTLPLLCRRRGRR